MQYIVGGLVGVVVTLVLAILVANYAPQRRPLASALDEALKIHWRQWDANEEERNLYLARIADAAETWEARYTRRKKAPVASQETGDGQ
jgi:hypothetical protein